MNLFEIHFMIAFWYFKHELNEYIDSNDDNDDIIWCEEDRIDNISIVKCKL